MTPALSPPHSPPVQRHVAHCYATGGSALPSTHAAAWECIHSDSEAALTSEQLAVSYLLVPTLQDTGIWPLAPAVGGSPWA